MKIQKPNRDCTVTVTLTEAEKVAIGKQAESEGRTISGFIRHKLCDVLEGVNNDRD